MLETIQQQTIELMNQGKNLDEVIRGVVFPEKLLARPYLRPVYDDPEFIIRFILFFFLFSNQFIYFFLFNFSFFFLEIFGEDMGVGLGASPLPSNHLPTLLSERA